MKRATVRRGVRRRRVSRSTLFLRSFRKRFSRRKQGKALRVKPSDLRRRKQLRSRRRVGLILGASLLLAVGILVGGWYLLRIDYFKIEEIDVRGNKTVTSEEITTFVEGEITKGSSRYAPATNSLFLPSKKITNLLTAYFLKIKSASLVKKGLNGIIVVVEEREPFALFCKSEEAGGSSGDCFIADETGLLYESLSRTAARIAPLQNIIFTPRDSEGSLGKIYLDSVILGALDSVSRALADEGIRVGVIEIVDSHLRVETDQGYDILLNIHSDYSNEISRLFSALDSKEFGEGRVLEDIYEFDLRYGRKVYYRYYEQQRYTPEAWEVEGSAELEMSNEE